MIHNEAITCTYGSSETNEKLKKWTMRTTRPIPFRENNNNNNNAHSWSVVAENILNSLFTYMCLLRVGPCYGSGGISPSVALTTSNSP